MSFPFLVNSIALLFSFFVVGVLCGVLFFTLRPHLSRRNDFVLTRSPHNPILKPTANTWENKAVFNPGALALGGRTHLLYRAIGHDGISRFGYASSKDGIAFDERLTDPSYAVQYSRIAGAPLVPRYAPALYASGGSWGGCEDARLVLIGTLVYLIFYAFDADDMIRVAVASITSDDFIAHRFELFSPPTFISPPRQIHKNWVLFPEKINGEFAILHSIAPTIEVAYRDRLEDIGTKESFIESWSGSRKELSPRENVWDATVLGVGPPPLKTKAGWLVFYHAHDAAEPTRYKWGALLLDVANPTRVIARARAPVFEPDAPYENDWKPGIAYACGATVVDGTLFVYYGSGEMTVSVASVSLEAFLQALLQGEHPMLKKSVHFPGIPNLNPIAKLNLLRSKPMLVRAPENPILTPQGTGFESLAVFNAAAIDIDGSVHLLYRAMSVDHISTIGYARFKDGVHLDERLPEPVYRPRADFEQKYSHLNSGCEDPRAVMIDGRLYMTYVAAGNTGKAKGAITSISRDDFLAKRFLNWSAPTLVTIEGVDDKDICLLPEKVHGEYVLHHRIEDRMCAALIPDLSFKERISRCVEVLKPRSGAWDDLKVGIAGPPIKIRDGWLMLYHGIGKNGVYGLGAALLDSSGLQVRARLDAPILTPETIYEKHGQHDDVVFSCGAVVRDDTLYLYYGAADSVIGVATASLAHILEALS